MKTLIPSPPVDVPQPADLRALLDSCRSRHQAWSRTLSQSEEEIDQLLSLLDELPDDNYRMLRQHAVDYEQVLQRLKKRVQQLRADVICQGTHCLSAGNANAGCGDARFVAASTENPQLSGLSADYGQLKARCGTFLADLMELNVI